MKAAEFRPIRTILGNHFQATASVGVRLMRNLSLEKVRLLIKCGFYTRLYGTSKEKNLATDSHVCVSLCLEKKVPDE